MNDYYKKNILNQQTLTEKVPQLTLVGEDVLVTPSTFSNFEQALDVCKQLEAVLSKIRLITGVGRGLAANQIGSTERCFVTFVDDTFQYFINPRIVASSESSNWYKENCLSCGPIACDVERAESVTMSYQDKEGNAYEQGFENFWARLVQHECDHLDGIVNIHKAKRKDVFLIDFDPLKEVLRKTKNRPPR